jgi:hypothetical protein
MEGTSHLILYNYEIRDNKRALQFTQGHTDTALQKRKMKIYKMILLRSISYVQELVNGTAFYRVMTLRKYRMMEEWCGQL